MEEKNEKKTLKQWCAEHKKELIAAGVIAVGVAGGVLIFKRVKKGRIVRDTVGPALALANDSTFKAECGIGENDILFQNIVSRNVKGLDTDKIVPVAKSVDDVLEAFGNYFEELLDHVDIDEIEDITVCYDLVKGSV